VGVISLILVVSTVVACISDYMLSRIAIKTVTTLRNNSIEKVASLTVAELSKDSSGALSSHILNDTGVIYSVIAYSIGDFVTAMVTLAFVVSSLVYLNWLLTFVLILLLIPLVFVFKAMGRYITKYSYQIQNYTAELNQDLLTLLTNFKTIKSTDTKTYFVNQAESKTDKLKDIGYRQAKLMALSDPIESGIVTLSFVVITLIASSFLKTNKMTAGSLVAYLAFVVQLIDPVMVMGTLSNTLHSISGATEKIRSIFDLNSEKQGENGKKLNDVNKLEFENVTFSYLTDATPVLKNVSFTLSKGDRLIIFAKNGSGKTTMLSLIEQFKSPDSGRIRINGWDINTYSLSSLRRQIGYVVQEHPVFQGTLLDNLTMGENIPMEAVKGACEKSNFSDYVQKQEKGFGTMVYDNGDNLSGGQQQKVSIARCLLRNPSLVLLDEVTANMDMETRKSTFETLSNAFNDEISVLVSHDYSDLIWANKVLLLSDSVVRFFGSRKEFRKKYSEDEIRKEI